MNFKISGRLFNGLNATSHEASLLIENERFKVETASGLLPIEGELSELHLAARIGSVPRVLETKNGIRFETEDFSAIESLEKKLNKSQLIHKIESLWKIAIPVALMMFLTVLYIYKVLIPKYAVILAPKIPDSVAEHISEPAEKYLEKTSRTDTSDLSDDQRERFNAAVEDLRSEFPDKKIQVDLISDKAPNAFVLPNGHIFVTRGLVQLSQTSDEILSVLLHEMGHKVYFHVMQAMIESSALSILVISISGGSEWTNIPILLLQSSYSRENESAADNYAVQRMKLIGKDPTALADMFEHMEKSDKVASGIPSFLSSHPSFEDRKELIRKAK